MREGEDFYIEDGLYVFLEKTSLDRGYCCKNSCRHCPFESREKRSSAFYELDISKYKHLGSLPAFEDYEAYHREATCES